MATLRTVINFYSLSFRYAFYSTIQRTLILIHRIRSFNLSICDESGAALIEGSRQWTDCNLMATSWFTRSTWIRIFLHKRLEGPWESNNQYGSGDFHDWRINAQNLTALSDRNSAWRQFTSPYEFVACQEVTICSQSINFKSQSYFTREMIELNIHFIRYSHPRFLVYDRDFNRKISMEGWKLYSNWAEVNFRTRWSCSQLVFN